LGSWPWQTTSIRLYSGQTKERVSQWQAHHLLCGVTFSTYAQYPGTLDLPTYPSGLSQPLRNSGLSILKSAPVDGDLILVNQDLAGFFTSIDQDRFVGAWFMLLDFLRPNMTVSDNEAFSVYPGKSTKTS
jgi:hypothetical protein